MDHNNKFYDIILHNNIIASPPVTSPPLSPVRVQVLCSVVVWYSPEVSCEGIIHGYEVQFYDPNVIQSNATRYVGANRTFYGITEEDRLAGENTYVQVTNCTIISLHCHIMFWYPEFVCFHMSTGSSLIQQSSGRVEQRNFHW